MLQSRYKVLCLVRFSFVSTDGRGYGQISDPSLEKITSHLFAPERMAARFRAFSEVCLPSLVAQPVEHFGAVILASVHMPKTYKDQLQDMLRPHGNLFCHFADAAPWPYSVAWEGQIASLAEPDETLATVRLDDDDALSAGFTRSLLPYVQPAHRGWCVTFSSGLQAAWDQGQAWFWKTDWPLVGAGLAFISGPNPPRSIYGCGHHHTIPQRYPTIVDGRQPQFLVTNHSGNDSLRRIGWSERVLARRLSIRERITGTKATDANRMLPKNRMSLEEATQSYAEAFPSLTASDWSFLRSSG